MKSTSKNADEVPECKTREMMVRAMARNALNLAQGSPGFDTPAHIKSTAINAILQGHNQYSPFTGFRELRDSISKKLLTKNKIVADADRNIIVTAGAMEALASAILTILEPGDEIITFGPRYISYEAQPALVGAKLVVSDLKKEDFSIDWKDLQSKISRKTKAIIIGTPNNPTGKVFTRSELEKIAKIAIENDLFVISDEVYEDFVYEGEHISIASLDGMRDRTITVSSLSKSYAMTGWRLGYLAAEEGICKKIANIHTHLVVCAPTICQAGGIAALEGNGKVVSEMRAQYKKNRDLAIAALNKIGLNPVIPAGALYVFVDASPLGLGLNGTELAEKLLSEANVAVVPGDEFGESWKNFIRLSFCGKEEMLSEALARIEKLLLLAKSRRRESAKARKPKAHSLKTATTQTAFRNTKLPKTPKAWTNITKKPIHISARQPA